MSVRLGILLSAFLSTSTFALTGGDLLSEDFANGNWNPLPKLGVPSPNWTIKGSPSLKAFELGSLDLEAALRNWLHENGINPLVRLKETSSSTSNNGTRARDFSLYLGAWPLCRSQLRTHTLPNGQLIVAGKPLGPMNGSQEFTIEDFGSPDMAAELLANDVRNTFSEVADRYDHVVANRTPCLQAVGEQLVPTWDFHIMLSDLPYVGLATTSAVLRAERSFLDATARIKTYESNPRSPMKIFEVEGMKSGGKLSSNIFETAVEGVEPAVSTEFIFDYAPNDPRLAETTIFAHAQAHFNFLKDLGVPIPAKEILLKVHAKPGGTSNNALYLPSVTSPSKRAEIHIGDGDGLTLQNLALDGDVTSHELGHHAVFQYLQSTEEESLVLHEALADYFVISRKDSPCVAETICPVDAPGSEFGGACWIAQKCLRTADNDLKIEDPKSRQGVPIKKFGHIRSQVISGMLWDLKKQGTLASAELAQLTYDAVTHLLKASGYRDFILALLISDRIRFSSAHCSEILKAANARGFEAEISDVKCNSGDLPIIGSSRPGANLTETPEDEKQKSAVPSCGTTGLPLNPLGAFVTCLAPLALLIRRRK